MKEKYIDTEYGKMFVRIINEENKNTLVFMHGWAMSGDTFLDVSTNFTDYRIIAFDFLGFGKSEEPAKPIGIDEYTEILNDLINHFSINEVILIGHSFGGRVGIKYASLYKTKLLFLVNAKAFRNRSFLFKIKIIFYKIKKRIYYLFNKKKYFNLIYNSGSSDYKSSSKVMKETMKQVVNYDLKKDLQKIKSKVVVIGSVNDSVVSYKETLKIYQNLSNGILYPFYSTDHFSYITEKKKFISILRKELKKI